MDCASSCRKILVLFHELIEFYTCTSKSEKLQLHFYAHFKIFISRAAQKPGSEFFEDIVKSRKMFN